MLVKEVSVTLICGQQKNRDDQPTAASLFTKGSMISCVYCDQSHPPASCTTVSDIEIRKQRLKKAGRCFIFLNDFIWDVIATQACAVSNVMDGIMLASAKIHRSR